MLYPRIQAYDVECGRFTQEDPIGLAGGMNLYGYAGGDPINRSDPFGLSDEEDQSSEEGTTEQAGPCDADPNSQACREHQRAMEFMRQTASRFCAAAKGRSGTVFGGPAGEVALGYGLGGASGFYASPTEFGAYVRVGLFAGLDGSFGGEGGIATSGVGGIALSIAGSAAGVGGSASLGVFPSVSGALAYQGGYSIPLTATVSLSYTHTFPISRCP